MVAVCDFRCRKDNLMRFAVFPHVGKSTFYVNWRTILSDEEKSTRSDKIAETQVINCFFRAETCPNNNFDDFQRSKLTNLMHNALLFKILMLETIESTWFWC